jgi:hypothetical protein
MRCPERAYPAGCDWMACSKGLALAQISYRSFHISLPVSLLLRLFTDQLYFSATPCSNHSSNYTFNMSPIALEQEDHTRDAEFKKAMHGNSAGTRGGMAAMLQKDRGAQQAAVDEYFKHWDNKAAADETEETRKVRDNSVWSCTTDINAF